MSIVTRGPTSFTCIEAETWEPARTGLWSYWWQQADTPTITGLDRQRLVQVLAQRSVSETFFSSTAEQWDKLRTELFGQHFR
ncbi:MAG: hypothetical protein R3C56_38730 [Pirellulaceae bacterium]